MNAWRRASAANERAYRELAEVLEAAARSERPVETVPPSAFKLIYAAKLTEPLDRSREAREAGSARRQSQWPLRWLGMGGAAAAVLVLGFIITRMQATPPIPAAFDADEFVTGAAETATLTLRDGTVVRLAPQSRLRLRGGTPAREISLSGRAYFAVAKDSHRPFRIETGAGRVEVLGTRFDLETRDDNLRIVVVEGRVALSARGGRTEVPAGEMRRVVRGTTLPAVKLPDVIGELSWVGNFLAFQETPLLDAAREIEQRYGVQIDISDSVLARQTITTWFADQPLEQVITIFCMVAEARCTTHGDSRISIEPEHIR